MTTTLIPAVLLIAAATSMAAQSPAATPPAATPAFAVASIKPSAPTTPGSPVFLAAGARPGGQWLSQNATMQMILRAAYPAFSLQGQIAGGPEWFNTARFDINAKAEGDPPRDVMTEMLKQLLADRFKFKAHTESRDVDVYALVLARADGRLGPGLRTAALDCQAIAAERKKAVAAGTPPAPVAPPAPPKPGERPQCGMMMGSMNGVQTLATSGTAISSVATAIQSTVGRPVLDRTGLTGSFDIDLVYAGSPQLATTADQSNAPASVFTAVQEQLGLKLESRKEKMDVLVIDQVELPTPN
jgi:uncharacterized protein (TIGR03435 family)